MIKGARKQKSGFTLVEVLVVVVIVGVLVAFAVPAYITSKETALNKEAISMLELMFNAEQMLKSETGHYVSCGWGAQPSCKAALNVDVPINSSNWDFTGNNFPGATPPTFYIGAQRKGMNNREWRLWYMNPGKLLQCGWGWPGEHQYCDGVEY